MTYLCHRCGIPSLVPLVIERITWLRRPVGKTNGRFAAARQVATMCESCYALRLAQFPIRKSGRPRRDACPVRHDLDDDRWAAVTAAELVKP